MPQAPLTFRPPWLPTRREQAKAHDDHRGSARERGYTNRWDKARKHYLLVHPLCVCCEAQGMVHPASVVDHIEPHKGDMVKFWDSANWQGLCAWCDKNIKRSIENDWLRGKAPLSLLHLTYLIPGWVHPAAR